MEKIVLLRLYSKPIKLTDIQILFLQKFKYFNSSIQTNHYDI